MKARSATNSCVQKTILNSDPFRRRLPKFPLSAIRANSLPLCGILYRAVCLTCACTTIEAQDIVKLSNIPKNAKKFL